MYRILSGVVLACALATWAPSAESHPGKTNAKGCHADGSGQVHCHKVSKSGSGKVKKGADGKCYPPSHPNYKKIKAVKTFNSIKACYNDG